MAEQKGAFVVVSSARPQRGRPKLRIAFQSVCSACAKDARRPFVTGRASTVRTAVERDAKRHGQSVGCPVLL